MNSRSAIRFLGFLIPAGALCAGVLFLASTVVSAPAHAPAVPTEGAHTPAATMQTGNVEGLTVNKKGWEATIRVTSSTNAKS